MLLSELAQVSGTSPASIKYYLREGLLPAGELITATRADYGPRHVDRLHLIRTLRETTSTPIPHILELTQLLDEEPVRLLNAMELAQLLALGFDPSHARADCPPDTGSDADSDADSGAGSKTAATAGTAAPAPDAAQHAHDVHAAVGRILAEQNWPSHNARVREFVEELLADMAADGAAPSEDTLRFYARIAQEVATFDLGLINAHGESADRIIAAVVIGTSRYSALLARMVALAQASISISRLHDPSPGSAPDTATE